MSTRISSLPTVVSANILDTDILPIVTGIAANLGVTKRVSVTELRLKLGTTPPAGGRTVTSASTYLSNNAVFNVKDFGAFGDGATDDTAAIAAAVLACGAARGTLYFPPASVTGYKVTSIINITQPMRIVGASRAQSVIFLSGSSGFNVSNGLAFLEIEHLTFAQAVRYTTTPNAYYAIKNNGTTISQSYRHNYRDVLIDGFETGVIADGVSSSVFDNLEVINGKFGITAGKQTLNNVIVACKFSSNGAIVNSAAITIGDGEDAEGWTISHTLTFGFYRSIVFNAAAFCKVHNSILDYNHEFAILIVSGTGPSVGLSIVDNYIGMSGATDTAIYSVNNAAIGARQNLGYFIVGNTILTYVGSTCTTGIRIAGSQEYNHVIKGNRVWATTTDCRLDTGTGIVVKDNIWMNGGFLSSVRGIYDGNTGTVSGALDSIIKQSDYLQVRTNVTYSASMTLDCNFGNEFDITVGNGTAFTINAPTNPPSDAKRITITIRNSSGGAVGAVTWNAIFKMAAWTSPANGFSRSIDFKFNGSNWVEITRTTADVPN